MIKYVLLGLILSFNVMAGTHCTSDSFGNIDCDGDDGTSTHCTTDSFGNMDCD